jgi:hypothetical protein
MRLLRAELCKLNRPLLWGVTVASALFLCAARGRRQRQRATRRPTRGRPGAPALPGAGPAPRALMRQGAGHPAVQARPGQGRAGGCGRAHRRAAGPGGGGRRSGRPDGVTARGARAGAAGRRAPRRGVVRADAQEPAHPARPPLAGAGRQAGQPVAGGGGAGGCVLGCAGGGRSDQGRAGRPPLPCRAGHRARSTPWPAGHRAPRWRTPLLVAQWGGISLARDTTPRPSTTTPTHLEQPPVSAGATAPRRCLRTVRVHRTGPGAPCSCPQRPQPQGAEPPACMGHTVRLPPATRPGEQCRTPQIATRCP